MSEIDTAEPAVRAHRRRQRKRKGRAGSVVAVLLSLAVVGGLLAGVYYGGRALLGGFSDMFQSADDYPGPGTGSVEVTIEPGASLRSMGATLTEAGVVASEEAFVEAADGNPGATGIQPGTYTLANEMKASDAVDALINGVAARASVTVPEGLRVSQILPRLAEGTDFTVEQLQAAVAAAPLPAYAPSGNAEGFLFPAKYELDGTAGTPEGLIGQMVARFGQAATTVNLEPGAAALGYTPLEIVTIASIVEREVNRAEDMPRVADVIYNRLSGECSANGIPTGRLQMDSTVHYAVDDYSSVYTSSEMRQIDSPYNTYRVNGLPPGPIASPGEAALQAALNPSGGDSCYFVAVNLDTGETKFAVTAAEHSANVAELQAFCRESDSC